MQKWLQKMSQMDEKINGILTIITGKDNNANTDQHPLNFGHDHPTS